MKRLTYGVREFQTQLGAALRAVQRGDEVIVTSRGRPVAVLARPNGKRPGETPLEARLRRLAAEGKIVLGHGGPIRDFPVFRLSGLARQLEEDRSRLDAAERPRSRAPRRRT